MFTVEENFDHSQIIALCSKDEHHDVSLTFTDDGDVWISQYDLEYDIPNVICISMEQWLSLISGVHLTEGTYDLEKNK